MIDISTLDNAKVLAALYNASQPLGLGFLQATSEDMTTEEARTLLESYEYFDYLKGRVMKIFLSKDSTELDPRLYDRDNGSGAAQHVIDELELEFINEN